MKHSLLAPAYCKSSSKVYDNTPDIHTHFSWPEEHPSVFLGLNKFFVRFNSQRNPVRLVGQKTKVQIREHVHGQLKIIWMAIKNNTQGFTSK